MKNEDSLDQIDYVLVYDKQNTVKNLESIKIQIEKKEFRKNYLDNLKINGLEIKEVEDDELVFVLIKIPFEKFLEVAEKVKFKLPIEKNDLKFNTGLAGSFWSKFESLQPSEIIKEKQKYKKFFMAPYTSSLHDK